MADILEERFGKSAEQLPHLAQRCLPAPGYTAARVEVQLAMPGAKQHFSGQSTRPTKLAATRDAAVESL